MVIVFVLHKIVKSAARTAPLKGEKAAGRGPCAAGAVRTKKAGRKGAPQKAFFNEIIPR